MKSIGRKGKLKSAGLVLPGACEPRLDPAKGIGLKFEAV